MRFFKDGDALTLEPWRARAFPVVRDLVVDRSAFDRIIQAGGYITSPTGSAPDANAILVPKEAADTAFDAAACIGCGACVASCPNAAAMLFTAAKVAHLNSLPQGQPERDNRPLMNKGTAFTEDERSDLGLQGLLPPHVETLDEQVTRAYEAYARKTDDLERHIYLRALQDTNEILFYRLLLDHIEEMTPMVYTPVVALACQQFSHIYRRPRGLFISYPLRDSIPTLLRNRPNPEVDVIVVTDGERILGIGDQGAGGLGIPIGKLSLYTLIGGIRPERTLPIVLDVGTNNSERIKDPEYLGWRHERVTGQAYFDFVDQFVTAVKQEFPTTCLQWEDFATPHARPILERYRDQLLTFNDDIQSTAAVALGAILGAVKVAGKSLKDQQIVFLGAGSAGIGVADLLRAAMRDSGLSDDDARRRFWVVDKDGLLHCGRTDLTAEQRVYAQPRERVADWSPGTGIALADVIGKINATILIGLSTARGAFTEAIVREMGRK